MCADKLKRIYTAKIVTMLEELDTLSSMTQANYTLERSGHDGRFCIQLISISTGKVLHSVVGEDLDILLEQTIHFLYQNEVTPPWSIRDPLDCIMLRD